MRSLPNLRDSNPFALSVSLLPSTLRSLRLIGGCVSDFEHLRSSNPVWDHLTNVDSEIALPGPDVFLHLLQHSPNLSSATIDPALGCVGIEPVLELVLEPFTHAKLQSLRFARDSQWDRPDQLPDMFNALSFPNLRVLEAGILNVEFKAILKRLKCPLESLLLEAGMTTNEQEREAP